MIVSIVSIGYKREIDIAFKKGLFTQTVNVISSDPHLHEKYRYALFTTVPLKLCLIKHELYINFCLWFALISCRKTSYNYQNEIR